MFVDAEKVNKTMKKTFDGSMEFVLQQNDNPKACCVSQ